MNKPTKTLITLFVSAAVALIFAVPAQADTNGDWDVTLENADASSLSLSPILSVPGPDASISMTTGKIWDILNSDGISQSWALEFILNVNETGKDTGLDVSLLSLSFDGLNFDLTYPVAVPYDKSGGASSYEARFRAALPFNFMTEYASDPIARAEPFTLSAVHANFSDGPDVYSLDSVTVTPEPWAMVLMAIGGIPIAANLYRKRKKA